MYFYPFYCVDLVIFCDIRKHLGLVTWCCHFSMRRALEKSKKIFERYQATASLLKLCSAVWLILTDMMTILRLDWPRPTTSTRVTAKFFFSAVLWCDGGTRNRATSQQSIFIHGKLSLASEFNKWEGTNQSQGNKQKDMLLRDHS